ncbi:MAG: o-succinylbenzoate--CoA ligase, partial [Veillonella sp.]|nr:o-succinylbenzoate--CoA ligase [Veillonella sp.]
MDWLQKQALEKGHKVFLNGLTFQEVSGRVEDIAGRLQATVGPMKRVAIWSHNSLDMALVLLALLRLQKEVL